MSALHAQHRANVVAAIHLHADDCRCHDAGCPERETCLRWLDRARGDHRRHGTHSPRLFPHDVPLGTPCPMWIAAAAGRGGMSRDGAV